jgi:ABC-2 type transport system ATP-binding protein
VTDAVVAQDLVKTYGPVRALDGLSLNVSEGTVLGLLGPNGAGKTTCIRILTTLLRPDSGSASVAGIDVLAHPQRVRRVIGLSGQNAAVDEYLTGAENLEMIGRLYHLGAKAARQRATDLLERFELTDAAGRPAKTYSGGMRRRLDLAGALVAHPPVIFMDEPTTGLDPRSRLGMWDVISERARQGTTLLLTTQYLQEADQLCDDIVVIDRGHAIARGTPAELKRQVGGERLHVRLRDRGEVETAQAVLKSVGTEEPTVDVEAHHVSVPVARGAPALIEAVRQLDSAGIEPNDIEVRKPTLDDAFLTLTGAMATSSDESTQSAGRRRGGRR